MLQRTPRASEGTRRTRLLIERDDPAYAVSDFAVFERAGFDVAFCRGPAAHAEECPLVRGERCALAEEADVVLHGLQPGVISDGVLAALRAHHPDVHVVLEAPAMSVPGQIRALRRAAVGMPATDPPAVGVLAFVERSVDDVSEAFGEGGVLHGFEPGTPNRISTQVVTVPLTNPIPMQLRAVRLNTGAAAVTELFALVPAGLAAEARRVLDTIAARLESAP